MAIELLCKKLGMTQVFTDAGEAIGVTVLEAGPNVVVQRKTEDKDGYTAVQLAFGRAPMPDERERLEAYLAEMREYHAGIHPEPKEYPTRINRSVVEEFSGKPFSYEEILPVFEDYVADKKAADVDGDTRALADLCLVLFNSNEFVFAY